MKPPAHTSARFHLIARIFILTGIFAYLLIATVWIYMNGALGDFVHFYDAARGLLKGEHIYTYEEIETTLTWYAYLPFFAVLMAPLALFSFPVAGAIWGILNTLMLAILLFLGIRECMQRFEIKTGTSQQLLVAILALLPLLDKIRHELELGQSDLLIGLCMFLGLKLADRRPIAAGICLAVATNVKLQGLVFLPYLIVRRRYMQAMSQGVSCAVFAFGGSLLWGWERNLEYLRISLGSIAELAGFGASEAETFLWPLTWNRSVSIPSVLARLRDAAGATDALVVGGIFLAASILLAIGVAVYRRHRVALFRRRQFRDGVDPFPALTLIEWAGLIVAMLAFSPQTSPRHFVPVLFLCCITATLLVVHSRTRVPVVFALALFAAGIMLPPGGEVFHEAVHAWRAVGGPLWCLLVLYFITLHATLHRLCDHTVHTEVAA